jgi:hypothetical protein
LPPVVRTILAAGEAPALVPNSSGWLEYAAT